MRPTRRNLQALRVLPDAVEDSSGANSKNRASHGRAAHRLLGARHAGAGEGIAPGRGRARHRRPPDGELRLDAPVLVSLPEFTARASKRRPTTIRSAGITCTCCTAEEAQRLEWVRAMHTSLILYAEHEFNASTFTCRVITGTGSDMYSAITGGIGALRGPKHGGANEVSDEIQKRYKSADEAEADIRRRMAAKEIVIGFGHPVYTTGDPRNKVIKAVAEQLSKEAEGHDAVADRRAHRVGDVDREEDVRQPRLVQRGVLQQDGRADAALHAAVRASRAPAAGRRTSSSSASTARSSARPPTTPAPRTASGCR